MRAVLASLVLFSLGPLSFAGQVLVVGPGSGQIPSIQTAVTLAQDGDIVLVKSGSYASFSLGDKSLAVVADTGAVVQVGGIGITGLSSDKYVVLSRLISLDSYGLYARNCSGKILAQDCSFHAGSFPSSFDVNCGPGLGPSGVDVASCSAVALTRCQAQGGWASAALKNGCGLLIDSASRVVVHSSTAIGGTGGSCILGFFQFGHDGGDGLQLLGGSSLYASSTLLSGADGTVMSNDNNGFPGTGSSATGGSSWVVRDTPVSFSPPPGIAPLVLTGRTPALTGSTLVRDNATATFTTTAPDGSHVYLACGTDATFAYTTTVYGVRLVGSPRRFQERTVTTGGQVSWPSLTLPNLSSSNPGMVFFVQAVVSSTSGPQLSNVQAVVLVDAAF